MLLPVMDRFDAARAAAEDSARDLEREVKRLRRACCVPSDATLDDSTLAWCRVEPTPQGGQKLVPIPMDK